MRLLATADRAFVTASVAAVTEIMLVDFEHKVHRAANADEALRILWSDAEIDVLFSDVVMPGGMNGASSPNRQWCSVRS